MFEVDDEDWTNDDFMFDQFTRMRLNHIDQDVQDDDMALFEDFAKLRLKN